MPDWIVNLARQVQHAAIFRLIWTLPPYVIAILLLAAILIVAIAETAPG